MKKDEIEMKLREIIVASKPQITLEDFEKGVNLHEFNFDSIELMQLVVEIETEFDIEIGEENFSNEVLLDYGKLLEIVIQSTNSKS